MSAISSLYVVRNSDLTKVEYSSKIC